MRIRFVVFNAYAYGGTTRSVINQANALCADHDVEIASLYRHREQPRFAVDPRVRLVPLTELRSDGTRRLAPDGSQSRLMRLTSRFASPLPLRLDHRFPRWHPQVELALLRYFRAADRGILVTTRPGVNLLSAWLAPRRLVRVAQDHVNFGAYRPALRAAIVRAYPRLDAVVALTEQDRAAYQRALGPDARVECIPNGVPPPRLPAARLDTKMLVAAGRLVPVKGFDLLLRAFQQVVAEHPDWQLSIFGGGDERDRLATQIEQLGLTGRAHLKGATDRLDEQLAAASIFVLSSRREGLPMVMLEAMTAGLPVVAFDCPTGPRRVISHRRSGLLVPPQDVDALAAGIRELIEDPATRRALGAAARTQAEPYWSPSVRRRWEELYADLQLWTAVRPSGTPYR